LKRRQDIPLNPTKEKKTSCKQKARKKHIGELGTHNEANLCGSGPDESIVTRSTPGSQKGEARTRSKKEEKR